MTYLIIAIILFLFLGLSLCVVAGRADENAERLERKFSLGRLVRGKRKDKPPAVPGGRTRFDSDLAARIKINLN